MSRGPASPPPTAAHALVDEARMSGGTAAGSRARPPAMIPGGLPTWEVVPSSFAQPGEKLVSLDSALSAKFGGTRYELHVAGPLKGDSHLFIEARKVPIEEHSHDWSLPVDELRGRRVCRFPGCGHIATRAEMFQVFLVSKGRRP